eukprot:4227468-Amphidinium_carterae.1
MLLQTSLVECAFIFPTRRWPSLHCLVSTIRYPLHAAIKVQHPFGVGKRSHVRAQWECRWIWCCSYYANHEV